MRSRAGPLVLLVVLSSAGACSGARPPQPRVEPPPADPSAAFVTPARWDYHPPPPTTALAAVKLPGGGCAFTAEGGQRWSSAETKQAGSRVVCAGRAEASPAVAAEELTSTIRLHDGSWIYVGESGTLYETGEPLGAFTRTVPAPEPLARVAGAGTAVLAATQEGKLLRWEERSGWSVASTSTALAGARVFDLAVAVDDGGRRALALAFPEALFASEDSGVTWRAAGAPTVGARRAGRTAAGDLGVQGVFESVVWRGAFFTRAADRIVVPQTTLDVEVGRAASAVAVAASRAVLDGDRYYEVVRPDTEGDAWLLARGRIEGRLESVPLTDSARCSNLRLGARGRVLFLACVFAEDSEIVAELRRSSDGGTTWSSPLRLVTPDTDQIVVAVAPDGTALVTGVCRSSEASGPCKLGAPLLVREAILGGAPGQDPRPGPRVAADAGTPDAGAVDAGPPAPALHAVPSSAPQLSSTALAAAFGFDGRSAYFLGKRGKDERISLFVSHDGGETFAPRALQSAGAPRSPRRQDDEEDPSEGDGPDPFEIDETSPLHPGDDGTVGVGVLLRSRGSAAYITTDDDGRLLQVGSPPIDDEGNPIDVVLTGYGRRVLAVPSYTPADGSSGPLWESLDGGATWDKQIMPQSMVREYARNSSITVTCALAGCLVGETVSRVGWGGGGDAGAGERPADPPPGGSQAVLAPIVCDLSSGSRWSRIDDVFGAGSPLPGVHDLMRGRSVWAALSLDRATGALTTTSATLPESGEGEARVIRRPLLGARGAHTATAISATQVEGYAVVRAPYAVDAHGQPRVGAPLHNVEVAWENYLEGTANHASIADAGVLEGADVNVVAGGLDMLRSAMISISSRGFFVRVHARGGDEIFVDPAGRSTHFAPTPWPANGPLGALEFRADAAAVGGELLGVGLLLDSDREAAAAVLARRAPGGGWTYVADALLPQRAAGSSLAALTMWGSSAGAPVGMTALVADPPHARAWAHYLGFRGDGTFSPAQPVATLYDLGDRPRGCTRAERVGSARAAMMLKADGKVLFPGARHPVLVTEPRPKDAVGVAEPLVLLTSSAIVHGTPASPCLGAFQADSVTGAPVSAVLPGDLARSWLFRSVSEPPRPTGKRAAAAAAPALEYRPMACHYDAGARVPEVVWSQEGTTRP